MTTRTSPSRGRRSPEVTGFYHPDTGSIQYVAADPATGQAALIDVVADYDPAAAAVSYAAAEAILAHVEAKGLRVEWILDTHPHADHLIRGALAAREARRAHGNRREGARDRHALARPLQPAGRLRPQRRFRPPLRGRRPGLAGRAGRARHALAGPYAGIGHLSRRGRRGLRPRHVHATRRRDGADRLPRRFGSGSLGQPPGDPCPSRCDPALRRTRLRHAVTRRPGLGVDGSGAAGAERPYRWRHRARGLPSACAKHATQRCPCRSGCSPRFKSTFAAAACPNRKATGTAT